MLFDSVLAYIFLLASAIIAVPPPTHSQPQLLHVGRSIPVLYGPESGAVLELFPPGTFDQINATLTAPTLRGPVGAIGSAYIGIDGAACQRSMFRVGIMFLATQQGQQYQAWFEWYPEPLYNLDLDIAAGDRLHITVVALTPLNGLFTIRNNRTGEKKRQLVWSKTSLCMVDAGWYVSEVIGPLPNFGEVVFDDAKAAGNGKEYMPEKAYLYDNQVVTRVSVSGATVTVEYV